ncbi:MAG: glutamine synthetase III, partial [Oscillospiraceae bacterium]|nr:glutamine synthetase III [Oscillospiraceae bacterium]
ADAIATGMKEWALGKGATHYTHWFQPHTGITAEKHDSFLNPDGHGGVIMEFSGSSLIKGEADGSSFPSGGLRATFEARGYTAWDPTSPAFIKENVLCIPTAFCSYGGYALDKKTPLLRSMRVLNAQAKRLIALFGTQCDRVTPTVGLEQEYFIVDRERYNLRKDLIYTGRTLLGARPPKGQELDDHYYGSIKIRISAFMKELNEELWRLGIPAKTEHNEVAPAQHELAPVFSDCNVAVDHNQLTMSIMKRVAKRHGLTCLLHEKPFAGVNGSGKHNNWGLSTDTGINLFSPGKTPQDNARFLTLVCCVIRAVDLYSDLLRCAVATAGNDFRLGGCEAPPAIISIFLGEELEELLLSFVPGAEVSKKKQELIRIGADVMPPIPKDTTDRNRTSPFAFTGNKFEFRSPGSNMSAADTNTVLNTIIADSMSYMSDILENAEDFNSAVENLIKTTIEEHRRILFSGNGYSDEWVKEAERRGLPNYPSAAEAIPHLLDRKNVDLFERWGVYSETELSAVEEIMLENYCKQVNIEANVMSEMIRRDIIPCIMKYCADIAAGINAKVLAGPFPHKAEDSILGKCSELCDALLRAVEELDYVSKSTADMEDLRTKALSFRNDVIPAMSRARTLSDALERITEKDRWPYPSYGRLLYRV